jgi:hypothetical protein
MGQMVVWVSLGSVIGEKCERLRCHQAAHLGDGQRRR